MKLISVDGMKYFKNKLLSYIKNNVKQAEYTYLYTMKGDGTDLSFSIPNYNKNTDTVQVCMNGLTMFNGVHYTLSNAGVITLLSSKYSNIDKLYIVHKKLMFNF